MKSCFSIFCLLFFVFNALSQRQILYDLDSYKQVNFERRALNIFPSGGLLFSDQVNVVGSPASFFVRIEGGLDYQINANTLEQQKTKRHRVDVNISENSRVDINSELTNLSYTGNIFTHFGYDLSANYSHPSESGSQNFSADVGGTLNLGFGEGRIEFVNSAWTAVGLLQTLENSGQLLRILKEEEITILADLIGTEQSKRYFDFRLRELRILETISDYLIENDIIEVTSVKSTLLIQDAIRYDFNQSRTSGSRIDLIFSPKLIGNFFEANTGFGGPPSQVRRVLTGFNGVISYTSVKNHDVHWARSTYYGGKLETDYTFANNEKFKRPSRLKPSLFYDFGYNYYPNARNNFSLRIYSDIFIQASKEGQNVDYSEVNLRSYLYGGYNRYFSPRTLVGIQYSLDYLDDAFQDGDFQPRIRGSFSFGITHSIY